jgi:hypothetical protein
LIILATALAKTITPPSFSNVCTQTLARATVLVERSGSQGGGFESSARSRSVLPIGFLKKSFQRPRNRR